MTLPNLKTVLLLLVFINLAACKKGINYHTTAIYKAEASNLTAQLNVEGFIAYGHDLDNDGLVEGYIVSPKLTDTIYFEANEHSLLVLPNKDVNLKDYLNTINYKDYNIKEIVELEDVIKAAAYGPKGTYVVGQTELINVVEVTF